MLRIGIDTGGTFTDFIVSDGRRIWALKLPSTPHDPSQAIAAGLEALIRTNRVGVEIVHGTTVATNALIERKGARTALVTTRGFEDILEIGRQNRPLLYRLSASRPEPLVPRRLRFGLGERTLADGSLQKRPSRAEIDSLLAKLARLKIESLAVCFLFSYANPKNELAFKRAASRLGIPVCASHQILPEFREYERTSTTVVNAYLAPVMSGYIAGISDRLASRLAATGRRAQLARRIYFRVMQSNGGSISARVAAREPVRTILSGPAGGVVGAMEVARLAGFKNIISFDMGGTSTDVYLSDGRVRTTNEAVIANCPVAVPVIDIHSVGAGGGSIARVDAGGALRVGPESAGADPGPICYGKGRELTVTDAHVALGRIDPEFFLGGQMRIYPERIWPHLEELALKLRIRGGKTRAAIKAAQGIIDVANANMEKAIRAISIERGYDPRDFVLVSFGGAGALHACDLAQALGIPCVLVPKNPGLLSAFGMLLSDVVKDYSLTVLAGADDGPVDKIYERYSRLEAQGMRDLFREGFGREDIRFERMIDLRYAGQAYELTLPFSRSFVAAFHRAHERRYGYADPKRKVEIVTLRVRFYGRTLKPPMERKALAGGDPSGAILKRRTVYFYGEPHETPFYGRQGLKPGDVIPGPAVVVEYSATTAIPPRFRARVDGWENLIISRRL